MVTVVGAAVAAISVLAEFAPDAASAAAESATPSAHVAKAAVKKVALPPEPNGKITLTIAEKELRRDHLRVGGVVGPNTKAAMATQWEHKVVHHIRSHGHNTTKITYTPYKPKSKVDQQTSVWIATKKPTVTPIQPPPTQKTPPPNTQPTLPPPNTQPSPPPPNTTPAPIDVQKATEAELEKDVRYFPFWSDCSGLAVDNAQGVEIGDISARHCEPPNAQQVTGSDGNKYLELGQSPDVMKGDDVKSMTKTGTVSLIALPATGVLADFAVMAEKGHTIDEVENVVKANSLTIDQAANLPSNTPEAISGYPLDQPDNTSGVTKRVVQWFSMIGIGGVFGANGFMRTAMGANTAGNTRTVWSYGESGAVAVEPIVTTTSTGSQSISWKYVGLLAGFDDFRDAPYNTVTKIDSSYIGPNVKTERNGELAQYNEPGWAIPTADTVVCYLASADYTLPGVTVQDVIPVASPSQVPGPATKSVSKSAAPGEAGVSKDPGATLTPQ